MDLERRLAERKVERDPHTVLVALTRNPALRAAPHCPYCGRERSAVDVLADAGDLPEIAPGALKEWPWHGPGGRLALLAYAGDEAARALLDEPERYRWCTDCGDSDFDAGCQHQEGDAIDGIWVPIPAHWHGETYCASCGLGQDPDYATQDWRGLPPFDRWLRGLDRWPAPVLLIAAIAAGRAVLRGFACECPYPDEQGCWDCKNTGYHVAYGIEADRALDAATEHALCLCAESRGAWRRAAVLQGCPNWVVQPWDSPGNQREEFGVVFGYATREVDDEATIRDAVCSALVRFGREGVV